MKLFQAKTLLALAAIWVSLTSIFGYFYIKADRSFAAMPARTEKHGAEPKSPLAILIVGDSWVFGNKLDAPLKHALDALGISSRVQSIGYPGFKSGQIFKAIQVKPIESAALIVIIAGVNDAAGHVGSDYYSHHMLCLATWALNLGAVPVILQVPHFGIEASFQSASILHKVKRTAYKSLFESREETIDYYRTRLVGAIKDYNVTKQIVLVNPDELLNYPSDLFANPLHLKEIGNQRLSELLADSISGYLKGI